MRARGACAVGAGAALLASLGDGLLLWVGNAGRPELAWLPTPPDRALWVGTLLGVLAIPLYGVGYWGVAQGLRTAAPGAARAVFALGAYGGALGAAVHAATGMAEQLEQAAGTGPGDPAAFVLRHADFFVPLWGLLAVAVAAGSILFAATVARGGSAFPRWLAAANPVVLVTLACALALGSETGRAFLVPAAPNLVHVPFFALAAASAGASGGRR